MSSQREQVLREFLENYDTAMLWLARASFAAPAAAYRNFLAIARHGLSLGAQANLHDLLGRYLPACADPDRAVNNLERLLGSVEDPSSFVDKWLCQPDSLAVLLQLFATSQYFSELIIADSNHIEFLWERGHTHLDPKLLRGRILEELADDTANEAVILEAIRRYRHRELLRIGYRDIVLGEPLEEITASISDLADCLVDVALTIAYRRRAARTGDPRTADGKLSRLVILAMGKLGGRELNYSSDIDLIVVYDQDGQTDGRRAMGNAEFFADVVRDVIKLLSVATASGQAYRVDLRLRPHGAQGPLCLSLENTLAYYDRHGRTWERQALVKVRPIAGSMRLGEEFLRGIEPFVFRGYLTHFEINEIKAIKRKIESKSCSTGIDAVDLKTGHGGIRDIEFVTQFLQLVNGGAQPRVRDRNTLRALQKLARYGCINQDERTAMETAYRFLRKAEHRLQFMFDLQTHRLPDDPQELDRLAQRFGYLAGDAVAPREQFLADLHAITERNRAILNHLMHDLFPHEESGADGEPETDLILDTHAGRETITEVLAKYRFADIDTAYRNLTLLAREEVPFLSSARCRHFLASIGSELLRAVAEAPDPDMALTNLEKVTASLGAKGALWESFNRNPSMLRLYVNLCSWSQFLSEILINNPGMIDELLDTLAQARTPSRPELTDELDRLVKGAREIDPILHGFKNTRLLQIGVNDILSKCQIRETTQQLSELAEAVVRVVADRHWEYLVAEHGQPTIAGDRHRPCQYVLLGLGSFGGCELTYHSDLDLVLVYDGDGTTVVDGTRPQRGSTSNHDLYTELAQRIMRTIGQLGPLGRLYSLDFRLRPAGRSGSLALPLDRFQQYYQGAMAALWERQALTRARVVAGDVEAGERVTAAIQEVLCEPVWQSEWGEEIAQMRARLEQSRGVTDLKRGQGGLADVVFAVQMLQLKHAADHPQILEPNIWTALERIRDAQLCSQQTHATFTDGYTFLRTLESRMRIVHNVSRSNLPDDADELKKLAQRLGYDGNDADQKLQSELNRWRTDIRQEFLACVESA